MATNRAVSAAFHTPTWGGQAATGAQNSDPSPQILVGTGNNFVIDLADFGTQTEKGCPPLTWSLQVASAVIVTKPYKGVEQAGALDSTSSKGSDKPVVYITRYNSGQFYPVLSEDFCAQKICQ